MQQNTQISGSLPDDVFASNTALKHVELSNTKYEVQALDDRFNAVVM